MGVDEPVNARAPRIARIEALFCGLGLPLLESSVTESFLERAPRSMSHLQQASYSHEKMSASKSTGNIRKRAINLIPSTVLV